MHTFDESYFDAGLDRRGTRCEKWDGTEKESVLPLWVADMDFPSPPEVAEAIAVRALHPTYGYTLVLPDDTRALTGFWQRRHNLTIQDEWVMMIPCVVTGIRLALLALTKPGDDIGYGSAYPMPKNLGSSAMPPAVPKAVSKPLISFPYKKTS